MTETSESTTSQPTARSLPDVLNDNPELTSNGWMSVTGKDYELHRNSLMNDTTFPDVVAWVAANMQPRKTVNTKRNSYGLKHDCERDIKTYVSNGCLIAAALALGIRIRRERGIQFRRGNDLNCEFYANVPKWRP